VDLQYAEDNIDAQVSQLENMITKGVNCLVIGFHRRRIPFQGIGKAHAAKIPVIAYDRLIRKTPYVDYYATFDNYKVGVLQGGYIVDKLRLKDGKGPFNIELFAGSPDDNNAYFFFNGAMTAESLYQERQIGSSFRPDRIRQSSYPPLGRRYGPTTDG